MTPPTKKKPSGAQNRHRARQRREQEARAGDERGGDLQERWRARSAEIQRRICDVGDDAIGTATAQLAALRESQLRVEEDPALTAEARARATIAISGAMAKLLTPALYERKLDELKRIVDGDGDDDE